MTFISYDIGNNQTRHYNVPMIVHLTRDLKFENCTAQVFTFRHLARFRLRGDRHDDDDENAIALQDARRSARSKCCVVNL